MSDFALKRESIEMLADGNVLISEFENKTEQRRLITPESIIGYKIKTPVLTQSQCETYYDFFESRNWSLDSFTFTCPFTGNEYNVRLKMGSFRMKFESGYYQGEFEFERVF